MAERENRRGRREEREETPEFADRLVAINRVSKTVKGGKRFGFAALVVVGDQRPFIAALITLDPEMLPTWLENNGLSAKMSLAEAATNATVRAEVQRAIDRANKTVSRAESIRKFVILPTEWTEASGHLTPKMSIKRHVITTDFADDIEALYSEPVATSNVSIG